MKSSLTYRDTILKEFTQTSFSVRRKHRVVFTTETGQFTRYKIFIFLLLEMYGKYSV